MKEKIKLISQTITNALFIIWLVPTITCFAMWLFLIIYSLFNGMNFYNNGVFFYGYCFIFFTIVAIILFHIKHNIQFMFTEYFYQKTFYIFLSSIFFTCFIILFTFFILNTCAILEDYSKETILFLMLLITLILFVIFCRISYKIMRIIIGKIK